jgi:hypothetical protein
MERNIYKIGSKLYVTSDEEIKEGDWFYDLDTKYVKIKQSWENSHLDFNGKKIILTTDQDLIKDGVQAIDDEFLEWFIKNPSCEWVELVNYLVRISNFDWKTEYKIIIPQEEPKQEFCDNCGNDVCCCIIRTQETLEEAAEKTASESFSKTFTKFPNGGKLSKETIIGLLVLFFKLGTKWQQDQDKNKYSEEEVLVLLLNCRGENPIDIEYWFEQFKKK